MDNDEALRRWREKNAAGAKAIPVDVPGGIRVYVRRLKVTDGNALEAISKAADNDELRAILMAGMLCQEDGSRLTPEKTAEWTEVFKTADWSDYLLLQAAGVAPPEGSSGN